MSVNKLSGEREWRAKWIGRPDVCLLDWRRPLLPAPLLRKKFKCQKFSEAVLYICGLGYYKMYINGKRVGDHELDPVVSRYDKRVRYIKYDVKKYLVPDAENVICVILGNGWYNCHTPEVWHLDKAPWRDYPKLICELIVDGSLILCSDTSWKITDSPIVFDSLRNGEIYDARKELSDCHSIDYDDSDWKNAAEVYPPGGIPELQTMPPCTVTETFYPIKETKIDDCKVVYDIGKNIAGRVRISVSGEAGAEVEIKYGELLNDDGSVSQKNINTLILEGEVQQEKYILKGTGTEEVWESSFTYHGFQYAEIKHSRGVAIKKVEARVIHTAFENIGYFDSSSEILNKLQECTLRSYKSNFVGIPTDCPHREKNGWTGDAQLASETGLSNFDVAEAYTQWIDIFADCQRPNGQLPGIIPSGGWGFNWGSGPAWDSAFLIIPYNIYLYTGKTVAIEKHYDSMKKYVDFCSSMANNYLISFGLGDWCHVDNSRIAPITLTSTAYYYYDACLIAEFAKISGKNNDEKEYSELAFNIKKAFNEKFYNGEGIYANGEQTALGAAIYFGLVDDNEKGEVVRRLVETIRENGYKPDFGILGAKYVPRALAENGYIELAYKLITQPEFPGWVYWLKQGATSLWETWDGRASRNHIMFGDISAWMYQYLAGITPDKKNPGFKHFYIVPGIVSELMWVKAEYKCPFGTIISEWKKKSEETVEIKVVVPNDTLCTLVAPNGDSFTLHTGENNVEIGHA